MIRINLLPADLRRGSKLSPKILGAGLAGAIAVSAAIGWFGMVYFGELAAVESELADIETQLAEKSRRAAYCDKLEANRQDYQQRVQTIQDIGKSRRLWSRFCDEMIDVVNNNGETERHLAWFDSITVKGDPKKGTMVTLGGGQIQGTESDRVANFHEDLEAAPFAPDLLDKARPEFKADVDKTRIPPESFRFPLWVQFKPAVVEQKPAARKPAPKK